MAYPEIPNFKLLTDELTAYAQMKHEYGAKGTGAILRDVQRQIKTAAAKLNALPNDRRMARREPNSLAAIRALRPSGPRRMWRELDRNVFPARLKGSLLGRIAGCILGAAVEAWPIEKMQAQARENGDPYPPVDYWKAVPEPWVLRYNYSPRRDYTRGGMNGIPVDDDIAYTLLGLLIVEEFGPEFTTADVADAWVRYLPIAYTAEKAALANLKKGIAPRVAADRNNPYCEWIGADIRSDPWAYMAPGWPERAAELAYRDAALSHRRQGIYGEMFFAATISAAFAVDDPFEALRIGLTEIPRDCALARGVRWAMRIAPRVRNWKDARQAVEERYKGMSPVHTINNACLSILGLKVGGRDFTRVIGETVAMGMDNDCTAATAGSIFGAVYGDKAIAPRWHRRSHNTIHSYLIGKPRFTISGVLKRFLLAADMISRERA